MSIDQFDEIIFFRFTESFFLTRKEESLRFSTTHGKNKEVQMLRFRAACRTHIGCVREKNEDYFGIDEKKGLYIVCDGIGGLDHGEVASRMAVLRT